MKTDIFDAQVTKAAGLVAAVIASVTVVAMVRKGIWYDEAWSLFMVQHPDRWIYDAHPPLFYFTASLFGPESPLTGRLLNFLFLGIGALTVLSIARPEPRAHNPLALAAIILLANPLTLYAVIDFRSYGLAIASWSVAVASFLIVSLREEDFRRQDWLTALFGGVGIVLALNLHYVGAILTGLMLGNFIVSEWMNGQRRWAAVHTLFGLAGSAFLLWTLSIHLPHLQSIKGELQWGTSTFGAIKVAGSVLVLLFGANFVAICLAVLRWPGGREIRFAVTCIIAIGIAVLAALLLNALHGVLLRRYLMPLAPVAAVLLGSLGARNLSRRLLTAVVGNALVVAAAYLLLDARENWNELGEKVGRIVAACPSTQVLGVQNWRMLGSKPYPLIDQRRVYSLGYQEVGRKYGFRPKMAEGHSQPGNCPVVVWAEHYRAPVPDPRDIARRAGVQGELRSIESHDAGFIAVFER